MLVSRFDVASVAAGEEVEANSPVTSAELVVDATNHMEGLNSLVITADGVTPSKNRAMTKPLCC